MKKIILLILFMVAGYFCFGQLNYYVKYKENGNDIEFTTNKITSDFGKRRGNLSHWHRGIDYGGIAKGTRLLAISGGTVAKIETGYVVLIIDGSIDFGYGHLFKNGSLPLVSGNMVLTYLDNSTLHKAIIDLNTGVAIGEIPGTATYNGTPYTVVTTVNQYDEIAPIGDSGGNYPTHLHLYRFYDINQAIADYNDVDNDKDPLEVVHHDNTNYTVEIEGKALTINSQSYINSNDIIIFSGENSISFRARWTMDGAATGATYNNTVMDVDLVELFIKQESKPVELGQLWGNQNSNYKLIKGHNYESKLSHGARMNSDIYPACITQQNNYGSTTNTGIYPHAYNSSSDGYPYDDYYFSDFRTRIHKNDNFSQSSVLYGYNNDDVRYHDGSYNLYARIIDVNGHFGFSNNNTPPEIVVDNFLPFIQQVEVFKTGVTNAVYWGEWQLTGATATFDRLHGYVMPGSSIIIKIKPSEKLENINLDIDIMENDVVLSTVSNAGTYDSQTNVYTYDIGIISQYYFTKLQLKISGTDKAGNPLMGLDYYLTNYIYLNPTFTIPHRTGTNSWSATVPANNTDLVHTIYFGCNNFGSSGGNKNMIADTLLADSIITKMQTREGTEEIPPCLVPDFYASNTNLTAGGTTNFYNTTLFSPGDILSWYWEFEGGTPSTSSSENLTVQYNTPGVYKVRLVAMNQSLVETEEKEGYITVTPTDGSPLADFQASPTVVETGQDVYFYDNSLGSGITTWYWDFGNGNYSSDVSPVESFFSHGEYTVSLTVTNSSGSSHTTTKNQYIKVLDQYSNEIWCDNFPSFIFPGGSTNISGGYNWAPNQNNIYHFTFNFGDGQEWLISNADPIWTSVNHSYNIAGSYTPYLEIMEVNNNSVVEILTTTCPEITVYGEVQPLTADFVYESPVYKDELITFTDASSGGALNVNPAQNMHYWVLSDDNNVIEDDNDYNMTNFEYTFTSTGNYYLYHYVVDAELNNNGITKTIQVVEPPPVTKCIVSFLDRNIPISGTNYLEKGVEHCFTSNSYDNEYLSDCTFGSDKITNLLLVIEKHLGYANLYGYVTLNTPPAGGYVSGQQIKYTFEEPGTYFATLYAWNNARQSTNNIASDILPSYITNNLSTLHNNINNDPYIDYSKTGMYPIYVKDCGPPYKEYTGPISQNSINITEAEEFQFGGTGMPATTILSNVNQTFTARETIVLDVGFSTEQGSHVIFQIADCGVINNPCIYAKTLNATDTNQQNLISEFKIFPNPCNKYTNISFSGNNSNYTEIVIYNIIGKEGQTIFKGFASKGENIIQYDTSELPDGIYLCKYLCNDDKKVIKIIKNSNY
ncbi:MAG: PKD domain-containing protein [Bacteroidota bacterium]